MPITRRTAMTGICLGSSGLVMGCAGGLAMAESPVIEVRAPAGATSGTLKFGALEFPCMVGRSGILYPKFEGDGGTPAGLFPLREVRYRADRIAPPKTKLPLFAANQADGWCDDPADPFYNKIVRLPYQTDAETMWRTDHAYDVLAVIGYNDAPPIPALGSAIFLHVMRTDGDKALPTEGCVSMTIENLLAVLAECTPATMMRIRTA